jgi:hypothetical protein
MLLINMLGFLNSCINPFIYVMSDRFRERYQLILQSWFCALCIKVGWISRLQEWHQGSTRRSNVSQISINSSLRRLRDIANKSARRDNVQVIAGVPADASMVGKARLLSITSDQVLYHAHTGAGTS